MNRYQIRNIASGHDLGAYVATDPAAALEAMAHDAGYRSYEHACLSAPVGPGEIRVEEIEECPETVR